MHNVKKIALVKFSALGDIIWTLPFVRALNKKYPNAEITWITDPLYAKFLEELTHSKITFLPLKKPKKIKDYFFLQKELKKYSYDMVFCAQASLRIHPLYFFLRSPLKIGLDKARGRDLHGLFINKRAPLEACHQVKGIFNLIKAIDEQDNSYPPPREDFLVPLPSKTKEKWITLLPTGKKWIGLHPVGSSPKRTASLNFYQELIKKILREFSPEYSLFITGTKEDNEFIQKIVEPFKDENIFNLAGKSNLQEFASLLSLPKVFIAPDTGPLHVADAMGAKTIGLYAQVPPSFTGPFHNIDLCISHYPEKWPTPKKVLPKRNYDKKIMESFKVEEVIKKIRQAVTISPQQ